MSSTPFKYEREQCWGARDLYWQCLDSNNDESKKCMKFKKDYEKLCSQQWIKHFDRKRKYEQFKANADETGWELPTNEK